MFLAQVVGHAVSSHSHPSLKGCKMLLCQPLEPDGSFSGAPMVAIDLFGAGLHSKVIISTDGVAARHLVLPLGREGNKLRVALADPLDTDGIDALGYIVKMPIEPSVARRPSAAPLRSSTRPGSRLESSSPATNAAAARPRCSQVSNPFVVALPCA